MSDPVRVRPHLMLQGGVAGEAIALWARAFPHLEASPPAGPAALWHLSIGDLSFTLFDSPEPHEFAPTPSWSFLVDLQTPARVDEVCSVLAEDGSVMMPVDAYDFAERFAWVEDRFGISWQLRYGARA